MKVLPAMILAAPLAFFASGAHATPAVNCTSNELSQGEANICAAREWNEANVAINELYKELLPKYDAEGQALLRKSERAWIAFRDAECDFRTSASKGGSIWPMVHAQCLTELTRARIKQLEQAANCQEGDMSCRQNSDSGGD